MIVGVGRQPRARPVRRRPRPPPRRSSSSTSSTRSGGPAAASASLGGNDEREQTLNQILTEMDGFTGTEGVIVLAATNRPEILDPALLRPGRFDRRVVVSPPDRDGRAAILRVHLRGVPLADDVDLEPARRSRRPGWSAPTSRTSINEAALIAARRDHDRVQPARLHRRAREDRARRRAPHHALARGARAHRLPRERPRPARHAACRGPTRCARSRSSRAAARWA